LQQLLHHSVLVGIIEVMATTEATTVSTTAATAAGAVTSATTNGVNRGDVSPTIEVKATTPTKMPTFYVTHGGGPSFFMDGSSRYVLWSISTLTCT
jgi:hypothetical protein